MVAIAERVWAAWRDEVAQWDEPLLRLLLATDAGADAVEVLRESVLEVQAALEGQAQRTGNPEPPSAGEWDWVRVPDGVLVQVVECEALEVVLPAMASALERRGIAGRFDLADDVSAAPRPGSADMIECRVRVSGARREHGPQAYLWQAHPEAHAQILAAGERWCRRRALGESQSLRVGTLDPVAVQPREDVLDRMREAVADRIHVE